MGDSEELCDGEWEIFLEMKGHKFSCVKCEDITNGKLYDKLPI